IDRQREGTGGVEHAFGQDVPLFLQIPVNDNGGEYRERKNRHEDQRDEMPTDGQGLPCDRRQWHSGTSLIACRRVRQDETVPPPLSVSPPSLCPPATPGETRHDGTRSFPSTISATEMISRSAQWTADYAIREPIPNHARRLEPACIADCLNRLDVHLREIRIAVELNGSAARSP